MPPRGSRAGVRGAVRGGRGGAAARGGSAAAASTPVATPENADDTGATNVLPTAQADAPASNNTGRDDGSQSATPAPSTRSGPKFKPRARRRNSGDRAQLEEQREKDLAAKIKMEEREQRDADRRARRGGRGGRGGDSSRGGMVRRTVTGHGPFSAVPGGMLSYARYLKYSSLTIRQTASNTAAHLVATAAMVEADRAVLPLEEVRSQKVSPDTRTDARMMSESISINCATTPLLNRLTVVLKSRLVRCLTAFHE